MEVDLYDYIIDSPAKGVCVTAGIFLAEALRLLSGSNFSASNGWMARLLRRKRLVFRRIKTSGPELQQDTESFASLFLTECALECQFDD
jgi:hypothetical protein